MGGSLIGNTYVFVAWKGKTTVSQTEETTLSVILAVLVAIGTILLFFLRAVPDPGAEGNQKVSLWSDSWEYMKTSFALVKNRKVQLMLPVMMFSGYELAFWETIYPTCIGSLLS